MSNDAKTLISRRALLGRIGLAAGAAYVAPTLAGFNAARASGNSGQSAPSHSSAPSRSSGPSRNSPPSRSSRPSRPSRPSRNNASSRRPTQAQAQQALNLRRFLRNLGL